MIFIADSGSTKCDWALLDEAGNKTAEFSTRGMNPFFFDANGVESEMKSHSGIMTIADKVNVVFFYGSGCSSKELCNIISEGLSRIFTQANIEVEHDLIGAAYSTYDGRPGITAILGTGSNSCYFDGEELQDPVHNLAFILGDEASGNYFGKQLLRAYFYKQLPQDLHDDFSVTYNLSKDDLLKNVYQKPFANTWLAGFMKFLGKHRDHPLIQEWVEAGFQEFIDIHVKGIEKWSQVPLHCIGSVSYHFQDCLARVCAKEGIELGTIIKKPIDGLVHYHLEFKKDEIFK